MRIRGFADDLRKGRDPSVFVCAGVGLYAPGCDAVNAAAASSPGAEPGSGSLVLEQRVCERVETVAVLAQEREHVRVALLRDPPGFVVVELESPQPLG